MTWSEYRKTSRADMREKRYRTTQPILLGKIAILAGTDVRLEHKHDGFAIVYMCPCCCGQRRAEGIDPHSIDEVKA